MLTNLRKSTNNPIVKFVLFGALILAFGSWGVADYLQIQPSDDPAASVGDVDIDSGRSLNPIVLYPVAKLYSSPSPMYP